MLCPIILALLMTLLYSVIPFQDRNTRIRPFTTSPLPAYDFAARLQRGDMKLALVSNANTPLAADFKSWLDTQYPGVPASAATAAARADFIDGFTYDAGAGAPAGQRAQAELLWQAFAVPKLSVRALRARQPSARDAIPPPPPLTWSTRAGPHHGVLEPG